MSSSEQTETYNGIAVRSIHEMIEQDPIIWRALSDDEDRIRKLLDAPMTMWRIPGPAYIDMALQHSRKFREQFIKSVPAKNLYAMHDAGADLQYCLADMLSRYASSGDVERLEFVATALPPISYLPFWMHTDVGEPLRPLRLITAINHCHPDCAPLMAEILRRIIADASDKVLTYFATCGRHVEDIKYTSALLVAGVDFYALPEDAFDNPNNAPELTAHYKELRRESSSNHEKLETMLEEPDLAAVIARPLGQLFFGAVANDTHPRKPEPKPEPMEMPGFIKSRLNPGPGRMGWKGEVFGFTTLLCLIAFLASRHWGLI